MIMTITRPTWESSLFPRFHVVFSSSSHLDRRPLLLLPLTHSMMIFMSEAPRILEQFVFVILERRGPAHSDLLSYSLLCVGGRRRPH
jgi:hypothetical protein